MLLFPAKIASPPIDVLLRHVRDDVALLERQFVRLLGRVVVPGLKDGGELIWARLAWVVNVFVFSYFSLPF